MKKLFPLLVFVLLAFASCQRGPAIYEFTNNPRELAPHAEKFVSQVEKKSKHYTIVDWQHAVKQFVVMGKNFVECQPKMTEEEIMRYDNARLQFMAAVNQNGNETIAAQVKEAYGNIIQ